MRRHVLSISIFGVLLAASGGYASTLPTVVPYSGSYDEAVVAAEDGLPAGDYDTLGGLEQVGLFQLVEGDNMFEGSLFSPDDPADVFLIEVQEGFQLVSARLDWGTNLPGLAFDFFNMPPGFVRQNTFLGFGGVPFGVLPSWTLEESSETPTIFLLENIEATNGGVSEANLNAPAFGPIGPGIYGSIFDAGTTCGETFTTDANGFLLGDCPVPLDYKMTYVVERTGTPPIDVVPLPAGLPLMLAGMGALALVRRRKG